MEPARNWLVKQEPDEYSWERLVAEGRTAWTGVRNHQAAAGLRAMRTGDTVLFYHSCGPKEIVGVAKVAREAFPDETAEEPGWVAVELVPDRALRRPVTLAEIKGDPILRDLPLVKQSRLSVMPIPADAMKRILELSRRKAA